MRRSLLGIGVVILVACGQVPGNEASSKAPPVVIAKSTSQALIADPETYTGADLQDHELALTFDDGPGPMAVSGALAQWLHDHVNAKTGQAQPIRTTFFLIGSCVGDTQLGDDPSKNEACGEPTVGAADVIAKELSLGNFVGNHTATHRDLIEVAQDFPGEVLEELTETDALISQYLIWNRMFFRAPLGNYDTADFDEVKDTPMNKYVGPIYWNIGGGNGDPPVTDDLAADWACWLGPNGTGEPDDLPVYSTRECGDRYIKEIRAKGNRGIVLMHDAKGDVNNHDLDKAPGNTFDMLKYVIGQIEQDDTPWVYRRLDEVPSIAPLLAACDPSCVECSGPAATQCTLCTPDKHIDATGTCVAGTTTDGGSGATSSSGSATTSTTGTSSGSDGTSGAGIGSVADGGTAAAAPSKGGCNTTGSGTDGVVTGLLAALGLAISRRSKRRRT